MNAGITRRFKKDIAQALETYSVSEILRNLEGKPALEARKKIIMKSNALFFQSVHGDAMQKERSREANSDSVKTISYTSDTSRVLDSDFLIEWRV